MLLVFSNNFIGKMSAKTTSSLSVVTIKSEKFVDLMPSHANNVAKAPPVMSSLSWVFQILQLTYLLIIELVLTDNLEV